ncbi:PREDICTED: E3 ubiquitin-protein ligase listerin-like [Priapulus caudatus]|uniref:E3 ubiquitin-protein ligase listerin n=1 Tax=Priapulus caudatus TaxID=37621 RepID=A0ABM1EZE5_PRICU|nr:PREDICTED: E3 ubiquitin-protein ligase listerin-like [Priapulus caudatus]
MDRLSGGALSLPVFHTLRSLVDLLPPVAAERALAALAPPGRAAADRVGALAVLTGAATCGGLDAAAAHAVVGVLTSWREEEDVYLYSRSLAEAGYADVALNCEAARFLAAAVRRCHGDASSLIDAAQWDFVLCSAVAWMQSCVESHLATEFASQHLATCVAELVSEVATRVDGVASEVATRVDGVASEVATRVGGVASEVATQVDGVASEVATPVCDLPADLAVEWREFFAEGVFTLLLPAFLNLAESSSGGASVVVALTLQAMSRAAAATPGELVLRHALPPRLLADDDSGLHDDMQTLLNHCCPLLASPHTCVQRAAFRLLSA